MSSDARIEYVNVIERQEYNLNDSFMAFGQLTESDETGFITNQVPNRFIPYKNNMLNSVTFELSLSLDVHERQVYSLLDILSDVGGLFGALSAVFFGIVSVFQYHGDHMFLTKDMFNSDERSFKKMATMDKKQ